MLDHDISYKKNIINALSTEQPPPFGMQIKNRSESFKIANYRFGFNGKEKNNELNGDGNSYDFGARIYNTRSGRWFSVDPLQRKYTYLSPYNFVANSPLMFVDPDGRKIVPCNGKAKRIYKRVYKKSTPEFRAKLDALQESDVIYEIETGASEATI